ncbi:MAG TPA: PKD domain-containing protein, partial [Phaeodactylibacter sp.]|nr:PKD domain-containing protein [Phaeodactylibacter sp.]
PPEAPKPLFSIANSELCANEPIQFFDESLDNPNSWFWEFGDGGTSNEQNPVYFYNGEGTFTVTLTVCNDGGCSTIIQDITITVDPGCIIENMPTNDEQAIFACFGSLYDSGGPDSNYVNNNTSLTTIYSLFGPITLDFVAFSFEDETDGILVFDGADAEAPLLGAFTGTELPESVTSTGNVITIVEITDATDNDSGFQINYTCQGGPAARPSGSQILVDNAELCDGTRSFSANTNVDIESWEWDFGDGHTSTDANPEHTFEHNGIKQITLTVCNDAGCETIQTAIYSNKLVPEISAPDTVAVGQEVELHGVTPEATLWIWDFGNGQTAFHATPVTTYSEGGWYDIDVRLINIDVHQTCDANHTHPIFVDRNLTSTQAVELLDFTVFPNPTTDILNLRGLEMADENYEIRLRSMVGQVVRAVPWMPTVSLEGLPSGMYLLEIVDGKQVVGRKRVIKE